MRRLGLFVGVVVLAAVAWSLWPGVTGAGGRFDVEAMLAALKEGVAAPWQFAWLMLRPMGWLRVATEAGARELVGWSGGGWCGWWVYGLFASVCYRLPYSLWLLVWCRRPVLPAAVCASVVVIVVLVVWPALVWVLLVAC